MFLHAVLQGFGLFLELPITLGQRPLFVLIEDLQDVEILVHGLLGLTRIPHNYSWLLFFEI